MKKLAVKTAVLVLRLIYLIFAPVRLRERVLILSRQSDTPGQDITLIADELARRGVSVTVMCRTVGHGFTGKLRYCGHILRQLPKLASSKLIVLDGYCVAVSVLPKKKGQVVVQIWHAMAAIKKFGWQNTEKPDGHSRALAEALCMHRGYDYVLAPSAVTGKAFAEAFRVPEDKLVKLCLPRVDALKAPADKTNRAIEDAYPSLRGRIPVLYVPTFRKNTALKLDTLVAGFDHEHFALIIKKHFLDENDYSWAISRGAIVDTAFSSADWLRCCRKVITDYSAICVEAAVLGKELYILQNDLRSYSDKVGLNVLLENEDIGHYVCRDEKKLFKLLAEPYDTQALYRFTQKFIEAPTDDCTGRLCGFLAGLL